MSGSATATQRRWRLFTLADRLAMPQDNFLLLRALAAAAVIYGHSYAMMVNHGQLDYSYGIHLWGCRRSRCSRIISRLRRH